MHIDFHHAATYVIARNAGFNHDEAAVVSYAAQYVDDAVTEGPVVFNNGAMYQRISPAHPSADAANLDNKQNRMTWLPFHFLPGNHGLPAGENPPGTFIDKLVCTQDSHVAKDMIRSCINTQGRPYSLQRLGITMHVLADTFAHQGFAGVKDEVNNGTAADVAEYHYDPGFLTTRWKYFHDALQLHRLTILHDILPKYGICSG